MGSCLVVYDMIMLPLKHNQHHSAHHRPAAEQLLRQRLPVIGWYSAGIIHIS